jgi:hypothetical protein
MRGKLLVLAVTGSIFGLASVATALATNADQAPKPLELPTRGTAVPNVGPTSTAPPSRPGQFDIAPHFAIFRRARKTSDPPGTARLATAWDGTRVTIELSELGLCITSDGTTACGDPAGATIHPVVAHSRILCRRVKRWSQVRCLTKWRPWRSKARARMCQSPPKTTYSLRIYAAGPRGSVG